MKVWTTLSPEQIRAVAESVGVRIHSDWAGGGIRKDGRAWNFRLALNSGVKRGKNHRYQRVSVGYRQGERRVAAVCWHGHRDFMRALFALDRDARIKSAIADYRGSEAFERDFPATAFNNVGSMMYPTFAKDACTCSYDEWDVDHSVGGSYSVTMQQGMIMQCPNYIMLPTHYRATGHCMCDQKDNADMREWGYTWDEERGRWAA